MSSVRGRVARFFLWAILVIIATSCFSVVSWFYNLDAPGIEKGQDKAQPILAAIEAYRQAEGKYPGRIYDLEPKYLTEIPEASWRHSFCYDLVDDGLSYTLAFVPQGEAIGDGWNVYVSKLNEWSRVDSGFVQPCDFDIDDFLPPPTPAGQELEDPFAMPTLPADPSPAQEGAVVYYYHCMPCHGEIGQGLTDEFRQKWVEDHQNCWERGCHGGRIDDEGFPIPKVAPAVIGPPPVLARFSDLKALEDYLEATHPPQYPGHLTEEEYRQVSLFLLEESGRGEEEEGWRRFLAPGVGVGILISLLVVWKKAARAHGE